MLRMLHVVIITFLFSTNAYAFISETLNRFRSASNSEITALKNIFPELNIDKSFIEAMDIAVRNTIINQDLSSISSTIFKIIRIESHCIEEKCLSFIFRGNVNSHSSIAAMMLYKKSEFFNQNTELCKGCGIPTKSIMFSNSQYKKQKLTFTEFGISNQGFE